MTNLFAIHKGATWNWELRFWSDADKTVAKDVSGHSFACVFKDRSGNPVISLANADFNSTATNIRKVTIAASTTNGYAVQELKYELMVTLPSGDVEPWQEGYVNVEA